MIFFFKSPRKFLPTIKHLITLITDAVGRVVDIVIHTEAIRFTVVAQTWVGYEALAMSAVKLARTATVVCVHIVITYTSVQAGVGGALI